MSDFIDANPDSDFMSDSESRMLVVIRGLEKALDRARAEIAKLGRERDALKAGGKREQWQPIPDDGDTTRAPFDGEPVLIAIYSNWGNRVHRVIWTDSVHGTGIFGWAVEDRKFGPYPLRGYTTVAGWQPLPEPPDAR